MNFQQEVRFLLDKLNRQVRELGIKVEKIENVTNMMPFSSHRCLVKEMETKVVCALIEFDKATIEKLCLGSAKLRLFRHIVLSQFQNDQLIKYYAPEVPAQIELLLEVTICIWNHYHLDVQEKVTKASVVKEFVTLKRHFARICTDIR